MRRIIWTDERDDQILALRAEGLSALRIGRKIGMTKGQVIGRLYRLERQAQAMALAAKQARCKRQLPTQPLGKPAELLELDPDGCRWGIGESAPHRHVFCGKHRFRDFSYCAMHYAMSLGRKWVP